MYTVDEVKAPGKSVVSGPFGSNIGSRFFVPDGIPVIRGNNLTAGGNTTFVDSGFVYLTTEKAREFPNCVAIRGDLVFTAAGTIGQVGIIPATSKYNEYIISNKQLRLRLDTSRVNPMFAYYWFSTSAMISLIQSCNTGSTIPLINLSVLKGLPIPVPDMTMQKAVVEILSCIDGRIEGLQSENQTLEAIARTIFKSWFVDFDPVRAKAEGREPEGMDAPTAALFPNEFQESELGAIPIGWSVRSVGEISVSNQGAIGRSYPHSEIQYVDISSVEPGRITSSTLYPLTEAPSRAKRLVADGNVIWSCVRPNRRSYALVLEPDDNLVVSTGFVTLSATQMPFSFVYMSVTTDPFVDYLTTRADGAAYPAVRPDTFENARLVVPSEGIANRFHDLAEPLLRKSKANSNEAKTLAALRDTLLPRLISGKLRMPEAEKMVEAVL